MMHRRLQRQVISHWHAKGKRSGRRASLFCPIIVSGRRLFNRPNAQKVLDEGVEVLLDLLAGHVEFLGEILNDLPSRALAVDAIPENAACLVEDVQTVDLVQLTSDRDQNEF